MHISQKGQRNGCSLCSSLLSIVTLACVSITISAEDNMAPLCSVKWPMCHLFFAATAFTSIITAVIVKEKQQCVFQNNQQLPTNNTSVFAHCQQTAIIITDLESVVIFFYISQTSMLWKLLVSVTAEAVERMLGMPTSQSSHELFSMAKTRSKTCNPSDCSYGLWWAGSVQWVMERERTWAGNVIMNSSMYPSSLLQWETTLWPENALLKTWIYPDEVPLRKTLNPHQPQAAAALFCNSLLPFGTGLSCK